MNKRHILLIGSCFMLFWTLAFAAAAPRLYLNATEVHPQYIELKYEISNPGYVELHLIDKEGNKVWIKGVVHDTQGEQRFRIPRKPLEPGQRYTFVLKYKGRDYRGSFYNEG
ncbi:MAG: hypothetical protein D6730_20370 [Bacteroidetes bacterium]|nr:MAG: hypothetical protein D6730_20370 [Bacteroidota bacterium]